MKQISCYIFCSLLTKFKIYNYSILILSNTYILEPYGDKSSSSSCSISFNLHPCRWPLSTSRPFRPGGLQQTLFQVSFLIDDPEYQRPYHQVLPDVLYTNTTWVVFDTEKHTLFVSLLLPLIVPKIIVIRHLCEEDLEFTANCINVNVIRESVIQISGNLLIYS